MRHYALLGLFLAGVGCQHPSDRAGRLLEPRPGGGVAVASPAAAGSGSPSVVAGANCTPAPVAAQVTVAAPVAEEAAGRGQRGRGLFGHLGHKRKDTPGGAPVVAEATEEMILVPTVVYVPHVLRQ